MSYPAKKEKHPLTDQYISLVGGGMAPYDAAMSLIGPLLKVEGVSAALFDWEMDEEVYQRIQAAYNERLQAAQTVRETTIERLLAIINQDVRRFFYQTGDEDSTKVAMVPVTQWSKWMSGSVKKIKYTQKTDPFGNTTDTMNLEFHDPIVAVKQLREIAPQLYDIVKLNPDDAIDVEVLDQLSDEELDALHAKLLKAI